MSMAKNLRLCGILIVSLGVCFQADAAYFESASLGPAGVSFPGPVIFNNFFGNQFYGVRFEVGAPVQVTAVGAHIVGNPNAQSPLFAAIVSLSGPGAFPAGSPLDIPLATTSFLPALVSTDLIIPLAISLPNGYYGLVFGAGMFGSPMGAEATLIDNGIASPNNMADAYFAFTTVNFPGISSSGSWQSMNGSNVRFVVQASLITSGGSQAPSETPEPASSLLLFAGLLLVPLHRYATLKK